MRARRCGPPGLVGLSATSAVGLSATSAVGLSATSAVGLSATSAVGLSATSAVGLVATSAVGLVATAVGLALLLTGCGGARREAGLELARRGRGLEAREELVRAVTARPEDRDAWIALARLEHAAGRPGAALLSYARAVDLGAIEGAGVALADLLISRATAHEAAGLRGRLADLTRARALDPRRVPETDAATRRAVIDRALATWTAGDRRGAQVILATAPGGKVSLPALLARAPQVADAVVMAAIASALDDPEAPLFDLRRRREVAIGAGAGPEARAWSGAPGPGATALCGAGLGDDLDGCVAWLGRAAAEGLREPPGAGPLEIDVANAPTPRPDAVATRVALALARYLWAEADTFEDAPDVRAVVRASRGLALEVFPPWSRPLIGRLRGEATVVPDGAGEGAPAFGRLVLAWELARRGRRDAALAEVNGAEAATGPAPLLTIARIELARIVGDVDAAAARATAVVDPRLAPVLARRAEAVPDADPEPLPLVLPTRALLPDHCAEDPLIVRDLEVFVSAILTPVRSGEPSPRTTAIADFLDGSVAIACRGPIAARLLLAAGDPAPAQDAAEQALAADETFVESAALAAEAAARVGDAPRAQRLAAQAIAWSTRRGRLAVRLVSALVDAGQPIAALTAGRAALGLAEATARPALIGALARAARVLGREAQAVELERGLPRAIEVSPHGAAVARTDAPARAVPWSPSLAATAALQAAPGDARAHALATLVAAAALASPSLRPAWLAAIAEAAAPTDPMLAARARLALAVSFAAD